MSPGVINKGSAISLTINGPVVGDPKHQWLSGFAAGEVTFGVGSVDGIRPEWVGAKADSNGTGTNGTDNTSFFAVANGACNSIHFILLGSGIYRVTATSGNFAVSITNPMKGQGTTLSKIYNSGVGSALKIQGAMYFVRSSNFSIIGNTLSEDGIVTNTTGISQEIAYCTFENIDSYNHGRHGLIQRYSWATRWFDCKFHDNVLLIF